ncbi:hypothetical protein SAMD00023353_0601300 [Rosellinia necatrix]|uniref:Uncharacterized protein n=1 Tax=Rosellinia necatrix TaxID=77044 RepID=A0A1S8A607_ROSNE|nr:hypothetical protein SAMD00023353_0601300 [Rosellinia necatrix]
MRCWLCLLCEEYVEELQAEQPKSGVLFGSIVKNHEQSGWVPSHYGLVYHRYPFRGLKRSSASSLALSIQFQDDRCWLTPNIADDVDADFVTYFLSCRCPTSLPGSSLDAAIAIMKPPGFIRIQTGRHLPQAHWYGVVWCGVV